MSLFTEKPNKVEKPVNDSQTQRAAEAKHVHESPTTPMTWQRPSNLPEIPPRAGYVQRWIRSKLLGQDDPRNVSVKFREGWQPRDPKTVDPGYAPPTFSLGQFGVIGVEGMVLCEMPEAVFNQKKAWVASRTAAQTEAVEQDIHKINSQNPNNPITVTKRSGVSLGKRVVPAPDVD